MKIFSWNCRGVGNPATVRELKQLLVANVPDTVFLCETKIHSNSFQPVSSEGKSGGLALLWRKGMNVVVQSYSKYHIDSVVSMNDEETLRFTGFYGQTNPSLRQQAWDMLRRVQSMVNEAWIVGGDFKAILNNSEKEGGRRNPKIQLDEFSNFLEELNLTDVMTCNGWFTWTNNRDGTRLVKERVDRFAISKVAMEMMPFLLANIVRQSKSDHEAIPLDTNGSKPKDKGVDHRVWFRYDTCWGKVEEAKNIINSIWSADKLGPWQYKQYRGMKHNIKRLEKEINEIMDGPTNDGSMSLLKSARGKLGSFYDMEEKYWAHRAHFQWLKKGDRNTRFFHVRASGRRKKNSIERLKDAHGEHWPTVGADVLRLCRDILKGSRSAECINETLIG
ncbi:hypothetical protein ES288_A09G040300v1 [Gossypium darwinii]|uniref:Endonuclease/exonuclease/phosphatase domain-containing protein n=1 Tax=Gossypium darwinii TaxID=34276 RepID=A0A5D2F7K9_GOSDA|nr:hypothetical protein ES288_A09G040300v1 [Gossypium darwinii]